MLAVQLPTRTVASPNPAEAKSRAGTEADLLPTPFRPERPPSSVEHVIYRSNREEFVMSQRHRFQAIAALACAIAASSALGGSSALSAPSEKASIATVPGKNGRIAFKRHLDSGRSTGAIFTIDANGKAERRITRPAAGVVDDQPDWSPDGSLIVFHSTGTPFAIYTVKPDGTGLTRISPECGYSGPDAVELHCEDGEAASFLPDGKRIAYTRVVADKNSPNRSNPVIVKRFAIRNLDGSGLRVLGPTKGEPDCYQQHFAPNGSQFVHVCERNGRHAVFVRDVDRSASKRLTPWALDAGDNPDWSPNGGLILFRSHESGSKQSQIYVVRPDGSGLRPLTRFKAGTTVLSYSFSPGRQVDHVRQVGSRRAARHLRHASERNGYPTGHADRALGQRSRLGSEVSQSQ